MVDFRVRRLPGTSKHSVQPSREIEDVEQASKKTKSKEARDSPCANLSPPPSALSTLQL